MPDNADPKRPTFDERLEAIRQTLELTSAMHVDNDKEFRARFAELATRFAQIAENQKRDGEHINALARMAEIHERRLSHEGGQQ